MTCLPAIIFLAGAFTIWFANIAGRRGWIA